MCAEVEKNIMKILICAATPTEANACKRALKNSQIEVNVLQTGMGLRNARLSLEKYLRSNSKPDLIVSTGFAGTFDENLIPGQWIYSKQVLILSNPKADEIKEIPSQQNVFFERFYKTLENFNAKETVCLSSPYLVAYSAGLKSALSYKIQNQKTTLPVAVDMESAALCEVAYQNEIAFVVFRVITDSPRKPFPKFVYNITSAINRAEPIGVGHRVRILSKGMLEVIKDPAGVYRFVQSSLGWAKDLEKGWKAVVKN